MCTPFCQLFSGPLLGRMSDRVGRKPLLIVSQIGTLFRFLLTAFAGTLGMVFLGRIIDGATAGNLSLAQAYISDVTKPEERAKSFGVIGIAFGLGFLIGPAIVGFPVAVRLSLFRVRGGADVFLQHPGDDVPVTLGVQRRLPLQRRARVGREAAAYR